MKYQLQPGHKLIAPVILFFIVWIYGCQKSSIAFGEQYIDNGYTNIIEVDSITPSVSTAFKDSVPTSFTNTILVGNYQDPYFGKVTASSFLEVVPSTLPDLLGNAQYDSVAFLLKPNGSYYGDTTLPLTYNVTQLASEIVLPEGQFNFYNTSSFPSAALLGSRTIAVRPNTGDSANIRLQDALGTTLFNMIKRKSDTLKDNTLFTNYFKGLRISSNASNVVLGFKDSGTIRVYYHETDLFRQNRIYDLVLGNTSLQFNNISYDRSGKPINVLTNAYKEATSTQTGNAGYSQSATGLYLKISFPNLRLLLQRPDYVKIVKAELILKPLVNSYSGQFPLPPQLVASATDALNEPGGLLSINLNGTTATEAGDLSIDNLYGINTNYSYDVTSYVQQQIGLTGYEQNGLLMIPPADTRYSALNRIIIGDSKNADINARIQLKIFYVSINR